MGKLDEVSQTMGEVRSDIRNTYRELKGDIKDIKKSVGKIEEHLGTQNGRIGKTENQLSALKGYVRGKGLGIAAAVSALGALATTLGILKGLAII